METKTTQNNANEPEATPSNPRARRAPTLAGGLAVILALIALVIAGYLWYGLGEKQGLFGSNVVSKVDELAASVETLRSANSALAAELASLRETQDVLKGGMDKVTADLGGNRREWLLAEAEQLMIIAGHRLQFDQDVRLALAALRGADRQIHQLSDPNLLPLRRQIAHDIGQLEALNQIDFDGVAMQLGNLASRIDGLPLAVETTFTPAEKPTDAASQEEGAWLGFFRELWRDLRNLVRIRHDAEKRRPLLPPEQQYFVRENLRLMIYGAQLALLRRDEGTYLQNLRSAQSWLKEYFDLGSPAVTGTITEIDRLLKNSLTIGVPDISGSLHALQRFVGKRRQP